MTLYWLKGNGCDVIVCGLFLEVGVRGWRIEG